MPLIKRFLPILVGTLCGIAALGASPALAASGQVSIVEDNNAITTSPAATFAQLHAMGVTYAKYAVFWHDYAPDANSATAPAGADSPSLYAKRLAPLVAIDQAAAKYGVKLGLLLTSPVPRWAEGTANCTAQNISAGVCRPSAADFTAFVKALGAEFDGSVAGVPRVSWWSIWNEPNYVPNIAPQLVGSSTFAGADIYRSLLDAGWSGLTSTGHTPGRDTIVFAELAPHGIAGSAAFNGAGSKPVTFLSQLYCESASGRRLSGRLASANGCGSSARAFAQAHPALFQASGVANHPYSQGANPTVPNRDCFDPRLGKQSFCDGTTRTADSLWTDMAQLSNLTNGLARDLRAYGSRKRFAIWNTEYGFWAAPPGHDLCRRASETECDLSPANAAYFDNWAEYLSWRNPQVVSFDHYELYQGPNDGVWTDGLLRPNGAPTSTWNAFEVPLFLPSTTRRGAGNLSVWGGARPVATLGSAANQVQIQFQGHGGGWTTLKTVTVGGVAGYFSTTVRVTRSGSIRLLYAMPHGSITSRTQTVSVR